VLANLLLGVNQGLAWLTTVIMKIDLVGHVRRGLATGINEAAGCALIANGIPRASAITPASAPPTHAPDEIEHAFWRAR
jgi:hypothetical protein